MSPCSGLVHLTDSNTSSSLNEYHGLDKEVSTGKSVKMTIDLVDKTTGINYNSYYTNCRIFRIFYNDNTALPTIDVIAEIKSSSTATSIEYEDLGGTPINTITLEELNSLQTIHLQLLLLRRKIIDYLLLVLKKILGEQIICQSLQMY